jgi:hypothetical protein
MAGILARFVPGHRTPPQPDSDASTLDEEFEERAAIREFDGKLSRADAEILARNDIRRAREEQQ